MSHPTSRKLAVTLLFSLLILVAGSGLFLGWRDRQAIKAEASTYALSLKILEETGTAVMQVDPYTQTIKKPNRIALDMFGYTMQEMDGMPVNALIPEAMREQHTIRMKQAMNQAIVDHIMVPVAMMECIGLAKGGLPINLSVRVFVAPSGVVAHVNRREQIRVYGLPPALIQP